MHRRPASRNQKDIITTAILTTLTGMITKPSTIAAAATTTPPPPPPPAAAAFTASATATATAASATATATTVCVPAIAMISTIASLTPTTIKPQN